MKKMFQYIGSYMSKWLVIATLVGLGGGLSAVALKKSIDLVTNISVFFPLWLAPAIGGILAAIIYLWDKSAAGFGTDRYISVVNQNEGNFNKRSLFNKLLATSFTLGFQGSGGVEGPMLVIGSRIGDIVSRFPLLRKYLSHEDHHILMVCGAAGAIGAIFRSPLGGGIFVVEVLYHSSLHYADLFPAMLSSTMGFVIYSMIADASPMFTIPNYLPNVYNVPLFILSGILAGVGAMAFMWIFNEVHKFFERLPFKKIHPVLGGALTGVIILATPQVAGMGGNVIQEMIDTTLPIKFLLILFVGKMIATSFTVASGGSAGLVIPSLFIGAVCGNIIAALTANGDAGLAASLVIAGMAASLASIANVPIAAAIMLVEMVGLRLGVPATLGSIVGYAIGHSRVIYGVTCPDHMQFEEMKEYRQNDRNKNSH